ASVINQYALEGDASAGLSGVSGGDKTASLGVAGHYADRPTITYTPMTGEHYVRNMLTPLPPASILAMVQAGWAFDFIFPLAVRPINGVSTSGVAGVAGEGRQAGDFYDLVARLRRLQLSGEVGIRTVKQDGNDVAILVLSSTLSPEAVEDLGEVRSALKLDEG